ncbi:MAG: HTTM domain-containing protein [Acidobacteriota bacterium]|nr:HTTM domain-containing protein [Acidobacteriota bacterium]
MRSQPLPKLSPKPSWNPLKCSGTDLPMNLTILVKVLAIVLLITNHVRILPDPWLPFIPLIDRFPPLLFQRTLQTVFIAAALAIVFNRRIRLSSLVLGAVMLIAVVSSKAYYGNNKTFCGLMLFLAGLHQPGGPPFLRWQLAITYFGAGLNKALDGDWHTGVFFENWAVNRLQQPWYIALDSMLPHMWLARFMCWSTIVTELATVPCLLVPRLYYWAILGNILFQSSLLLFTGTTFTLFFYSTTAASLAFVTWPNSPIAVVYDPANRFAAQARRLLEAWDLDGLFSWTRDQAGAVARDTLYLAIGDKTYSGFGAVRMIVLLNPVTYFVIAGAIAALGDLPGPAVVGRRLIVAACLVILMPPLAWTMDALLGRTVSSPDFRPARTV